MTPTTLGKNAMLSGLASVATHIGAFQAGTALTAVTGATPSTFTKNGHGMANGTPVFISALSGGTGLVAGRAYFVINTATNTFQLALTPGGTAVDMVTTVTSATVTPYAELSGGTPNAYTRVTNSWNTAADGNLDNNVVGANINVPGGGTVNALGLFSAITAGNLLDLQTVTPEGPYGAQGEYQVSDHDVSLMGTAP